MELTEKISGAMKRIPLDEYWPNFKAVAYAFYNQNEVFLFNHPAFHFQAARLALEPSFNGADTLIHYKDVPTAIINLDTLCISEQFHSLSFDPINMISHGNRTLHPYSFGFTLNEETYMISQPSVTYFKNSIKEIEKAEGKIFTYGKRNRSRRDWPPER